ncbi:PDR/VanB family oxidoreductase [Pseudarthrobacter sp. NPDC092419]|uniref:PDR/VanB family oxidoreductase n=1 Tax=Pseudarthrobacter sp. NPDC092419 TaxID=3364414 RepID=UPI00381AC684
MSGAHHGALQLKVKRIEELTLEINRYTFCAADGSWLPPFSGGSHITILIPTDGGTKRNAYSLMSSPYDTSEYQIAVRRVDDGKRGSLSMHTNVREGDVLLASIPANLFPVSKHARHHLFIAGGVGITPIYAQLDELSLKGGAFELHLAVRGPEHAALGHELKERYGQRVTLYGDDGITRLNAREILAGRPLGTHAYVCGPAGMVDDVIEAAHVLGWTDSNIHFERFEDLGSTGDPFTVTLARSGAVIEVSPEQSLLEAAEEAGHKLPYLCRGGACGECETQVLDLEGTIDHRDDWLTESERATNKLIMPCVSRATCSRLIIDA